MLKDYFRKVGAIDTISFDRNDEVSALLEEMLGVDTNDPGLIRLCDIRKNNIDHSDLRFNSMKYTSDLYSRGFLASMMRGTILVLFLAKFTRSLPDLLENSTAYTMPNVIHVNVPSGPTISLTCETVVPDAAPKYSTLALGLM